MKNRLKKARIYLPKNVRNARRAIYQLGMPIGGVAVERFLKETSSVPTSVSPTFEVIPESILRDACHLLERLCRAPWSRI